MNGLELSRRFYEQYGKPMLEEQFPDLLPLIAVGFVGSGSERFGFDDAISRDHDFEAGFAIFLPDEDTVDRRTAFRLERAYDKLPRTFEGVRRGLLSPVGGNRNGPVRTAEFYTDKVGAPDGNLTVRDWLTIPDYALAEATNGAVFYDGAGEFTRIREHLLRMPESVRRKRLAGNLLLMAQAGAYNFPRCIDRGEPEAAQLACVEFVNAAVKSVFLLNRAYVPYYKWSFRALRCAGETEVAGRLSDLLLIGAAAPASVKRKTEQIAAVTATVVERLRAQRLTRATGDDLERHAYSVNDGIAEEEIRNLHILVSI